MWPNAQCGADLMHVKVLAPFLIGIQNAAQRVRWSVGVVEPAALRRMRDALYIHFVLLGKTVVDY
jgi:hypothetical protein